ncbi:hypothetical protein [Silvimonas iriomotensis]|uniref:Uncharacterized protein n=1 Tax=Silvimonas iriomotensis TaxID=449662 RepID=A0ABQ2P9Y6_9NEIS|nr:hypothetical protein [Silvimonas iriomotensis]GGP22035.1 hypothetical protein GCM10010970_23030 [Silvimonas iriomotensis]
MNRADFFFSAIDAVVDLDDPLEARSAHKFMIDALFRVQQELPLPVQKAATVAHQFLAGILEERTLVAERVKLWKFIAGRDMSRESEVLRTRAAICVMSPPENSDMHERIAFFLYMWVAGGLSEAQLAASIESTYGIKTAPGQAEPL